LGYDLHITRRANWSDEEGPEITAEEWLAVVHDDPELTLAGYTGEHFALWRGKSKYPEPWLDWEDGNVVTKNPDDPLIDKMVEIAKRLDAKVQGDDGEVYTGGGANHFRAAARGAAPSPPAQHRSWFRRFFGG
jgi:hypothetical protein